MSRFGKVAHNVVNIINLFQLHKPHKPFSPDVGVCVIYSLEAASQQILHCDSARQLQIHYFRLHGEHCFVFHFSSNNSFFYQNTNTHNRGSQKGFIRIVLFFYMDV